MATIRFANLMVILTSYYLSVRVRELLGRPGHA